MPSEDTIVAPSGVRGLHSLPNAGQSCGFLQALKNLAADAGRRFRGGDGGHLEAVRRRMIDRDGLSCNPLGGDSADITPFAIANLENLGDQLDRLWIAFVLDCSCILILCFAAPASSCRTVRNTPSSRSSGSKPVMTIGTWKRLLIGATAGSHDGTNVAWSQEGLNPVVGIPAAHKHRRHENVGDEYAELVRCRVLSHPDRHRIGRCRSKPIAKNTTGRAGLAAAMFTASEGESPHARHIPVLSAPADRFGNLAPATYRQRSRKSHQGNAQSRKRG